MKHIVRIAVFSIAFATLSLFTFQQAAAADRSYSISGYNIGVNVNPDGSADFREELTYSFGGSFNGILRDVDFSMSGGIENVEVYVERNGSLTRFARNQTDSLDFAGSSGTYNLSVEDDIAHFKVFEPSQDENKTFVIKYRMRDAVTVYNDVAEFNRKLLGTGTDVNIENAFARITLPEGASAEELKVFAHGPLTGASEIVDGKTLEFTCPLLSPGEMLETLVLFPVKLVPDSAKRSDEDALPRIMENEKRLADDANRVREEARKEALEQERQMREYEQERMKEQARRNSLNSAGTTLVAILFVLWFPILIYVYIKYDRELKHSFEAKYYRELPGEYSPAEMSVLMNMGHVDSRDIMATLMDLVRKRQLLLTSRKTVKHGLFGDKATEDYTLALSNQAPPAELKKHEAFLITWFIGKIGDGNSVRLEDIKESVNSRANALQFKADYDKWTGLVNEEADGNGFFDKTGNTGRVIGFLSGVAFLGAGIAIIIAMFAPLALLSVLQGLIMVIFSARIRRRTAYGNEQHAMWQAFRNFLKDFSRLDKAEIPSIVLWEHYLVYAISLGVAKEVIRQLPLVFTDSDLDNRNLTYMYGASYGYFAGFSTAFDNTIRTVESAVSSAVSIANSADSSSSGGGGGFSGGSSGGGGGGGGAGAF